MSSAGQNQIAVLDMTQSLASNLLQRILTSHTTQHGVNLGAVIAHAHTLHSHLPDFILGVLRALVQFFVFDSGQFVLSLLDFCGRNSGLGDNGSNRSCNRICQVCSQQTAGLLAISGFIAGVARDVVHQDLDFIPGQAIFSLIGSQTGQVIGNAFTITDSDFVHHQFIHCFYNPFICVSFVFVVIYKTNIFAKYILAPFDIDKVEQTIKKRIFLNRKRTKLNTWSLYFVCN